MEENKVFLFSRAEYKEILDFYIHSVPYFAEITKEFKSYHLKIRRMAVAGHPIPKTPTGFEWVAAGFQSPEEAREALQAWCNTQSS